MPNGNTSITSGEQQYLFEVTPSGEVVWEYLYPGIPGTTASPMGGGFFKTNTDGNNAQCYRSYRYGKDYPGLAGKSLERIRTMSGRVPRLVGSSDTYPPAVVYYGFGFAPTGTVGGGGGGY